MALIEKLQDIKAIKNEIKNSIENKGVDTSNSTFADYSNLIDSIETGGGGDFQYGNLTDWQYLFSYGRFINEFENMKKNSGKVTNMTYCFNDLCRTSTELRDETLVYDFNDLDLSNCTNFTSCFRASSALYTLHGSVLNFDMSKNAQSGAYTFYNCSHIVRLTFKGSFSGEVTSGNWSLDLKYLALDHDAMVEFFNSIKENTGGATRTITIKSSIYNELTEEEIAIMTNKSYTLASA